MTTYKIKIQQMPWSMIINQEVLDENGMIPGETLEESGYTLEDLKESGLTEEELAKPTDPESLNQIVVSWQKDNEEPQHFQLPEMDLKEDLPDEWFDKCYKTIPKEVMNHVRQKYKTNV
tara:strand:- start:190 stop:546 length:357 start_codon:yes stop_codon:yes gene_type:complete